MDDLFTVDTTGDSSLRHELGKRAAKKARGGAGKLNAAEKQRQLLAQERELASLVFEETVPAIGGGSEVEPTTDDVDDDDDDAEEDEDEDEDDEFAAAEEEEAEEAAAAAEEEDEEGEEAEARPAAQGAAWIDEDDADQVISVAGAEKGKNRLKKLRSSRAQRALSGAEYEAGLRRQFESVQPDVGWAVLPEKSKRKRRRRKSKGGASGEAGGEAGGDGGDDSDEGGDGEEGGEEGNEGEGEEDVDDETDAMFRSTTKLFGSSRALPADTLSVRRLTDLNARERSSSVMPSVMWHPNGKLALTAGPDKTLRLFRADGADNPKQMAWSQESYGQSW